MFLNGTHKSVRSISKEAFLRVFLGGLQCYNNIHKRHWLVFVLIYGRILLLRYSLGHVMASLHRTTKYTEKKGGFMLCLSQLAYINYAYTNTRNSCICIAFRKPMQIMALQKLALFWRFNALLMQRKKSGWNAIYLAFE